MKIHFIKRLTLHQKILFMVMGAALIIFLFTVGNISISSKRAAENAAIEYLNVYAQKTASEIKMVLEKDLMIARTLSHSVQTYNILKDSHWKVVFAKMYEECLRNNPDIYSIWDSWELSYIDPNHKKDYGRYECFFWRENSQIKSNTEIASVNGDSEDYARIKREKTESVEDPYLYSFTGNKKDEVLMTSIIVPNLIDGRFVGVIGIDIPLMRYYNEVKLIKPFPESYAFLLSSNSKYIAHPEKEKVGLSAVDDYERVFSRFNLAEKVANGEADFFIADDHGRESLFAVTPITIGSSKKSWALVTIVPRDIVVKASARNFWVSLFIGLVGLAILSGIIYFVSRQFIVDPINRVIGTLRSFSRGHIADDLLIHDKQQGEIGAMYDNLNLTVKGLTEKVRFAEEIGRGNLDTSLTLLSDEDVLGISLVNMQQSLKKAKIEEEQRKIEDQKRQWANEGLAKFGEILRQNNDKINVLAAEIVKNVVHYVNANQGGLFMLNDDDPNNQYFELLAAFAYNRQKYITRHILPGEGLVGTCALEKQTIYLTEIPENYIKITSGLGEALPRSLLIVPLMVEERVLGVLELASFNQFEPHQIEFLEKLAQSIASTVTSVRTSIKTAALLAKTQQQAEEMAAQEEEVRQNLEEMETIKEELEKRNAEIEENQRSLEWEKSLLDCVLNYLPEKLYFKDLNSKFIKGSKSMLDYFGLQKQEDLQGKSDFDFFDKEHAQPAYDDEQQIIKTNKPILNLVEKEVLADGRVTWANTSKLPLVNTKGEVVGTFGITRDITESKRVEEELLAQNQGLQKLQESLAHEKMLLDTLLDNIPDFIYFKDLECRFIRISQSMVSLFHANSADELVGKSDFDFHGAEHANKAYKEEREIMQGLKTMVDEIVRERFDDGREQWVSTTKMPLYNSKGEVVGLWGISKIVTDLKVAEIEALNRAQEAEKLKAEISAQEVELLKKIQEIQQAQEETSRKTFEMENYINALNSSSYVIEYDPQGYITFINDHYLTLLGLTKEQTIGTHHSEQMEFTEEQKLNYNKFWEDLRNGLTKKVINKLVINEKTFVFEETYTPMKDQNGQVYKIIKIASNVSNLKA
jgi:PAS domain S-box-containing protein